MGIYLPGLVQGLTSVAGGALQGIDKRKQYERQAMQDRLAEELQKANIAHTNAATYAIQHPKVPQGKWVVKTNPDGSPYWVYQPAPGEQPPEEGTNPPAPPFTPPAVTGTSPPKPPQQPVQQPSAPPRNAGVVGLKPRPPKPPKAPVQKIVQDKDGNSYVATINPDGTSTLTPVGGGVGKPTTPAERTAGSQASTVEEAITHMERIAKLHSEAFAAAVGFIRAHAHGPLGGLLSEARGVLSDPDAIQVVQDYYTYLLGISPTYGGTRPTKTLIELEQDASLPPFGADPKVWPNSFQTMHNRVKDLRAKAGRAAPPPSGPPARFR